MNRFSLCAILLFLLLPVSGASADLLVYPSRVVFSNNERAAQLELVNNGTETSTYRINLINMRMNDIGEFEVITAGNEGEKFSDALIRFSPRQITLKSRENQVVRIMLRKPSDLVDGEYRSHLQFSKLPNSEESLKNNPSLSGNKEGLSIRLTALVGLSIPVIVRHGETSATVSISNLSIDRRSNNQSTVSLQLNRTGNRSVYGDIAIFFTPQNGSEQLLARVNGVAVYVPNKIRIAKIAIDNGSSIDLNKGTLRVAYSETPQEGGKILAELSTKIP